MVLNIDNKYDKKISFFVGFYFIASAANATMKAVLPIPKSMWGLVSAIWGLLIVFFMIRALRHVWLRSARILLSSYAIFGMAYLISAIMCFSRGEPVGQILRATAFLTFAWWIPIGVSACSVKDKSVLYDAYLKASYWISAIMFANMLFHRTGDEGQVVYSMFFGFAMVTPTLIHINEYINNRQKKWILLLAIIEVLSMLLYGNRSVLLSVLFFLIYKLIISRSNNLVYSILFGGLLLLAYVYRDSLIEGLINLFQSIGMRSRTLEMTLNGSLEDTSGRDVLWARCWKMIGQKPIFGWGLGGEFYTLSNGNILNSFTTAASAHNGLIQLLVELGIPLGLFAIILMVRPAFGLKKIQDKYAKNLILIFFSSYGITRLISADGFFISPEVAIYFYLFYFYNHCQSESTN